MIERIIALSIRHRGVVTIAAGVAAGACSGASPPGETPIDAIPDLSENQVIVSAEWPGHGPREVDDQVTYPLSVALQRSPGRAGRAVLERLRATPGSP